MRKENAIVGEHVWYRKHAENVTTNSRSTPKVIVSWRTRWTENRASIQLYQESKPGLSINVCHRAGGRKAAWDLRYLICAPAHGSRELD